MWVMAERKKRTEASERPPGKTSGRSKYKTLGIPAELYDELATFAESQERSIQWLGRKILRKGLDEMKGGAH
jgi:hypothetical protein